MLTKKPDGPQSQPLTTKRKADIQCYQRVDAEAFMASCIDNLPASVASFQYRIAGVVVDHLLYGSNTVDFLNPALAHLSVSKQAIAEYTVYSIDGGDINTSLPAPFWSWSDVDAQGYILGLREVGFTAHWDAYTDTFRILDRSKKIAVHWMRDLKLVPFWERSFPLRKLLSWWLEPTALQPLHAAAVSVDGLSILITAKGGSGKSTTALNCLLDGMDYLGDDFVVVDTEKHRVYSLYNVVKLTERDVRTFPSLKIDPREVAHAEDQEKVQIFLKDQFPEQIISAAQIAGIVVPRIVDQDTTNLGPCPKEDVVAAIATSTLYLLKGNSIGAMKKITKIVHDLPCFYLNLGRDFNTSPSVLRNLITKLSGNG